MATFFSLAALFVGDVVVTVVVVVVVVDSTDDGGNNGNDTGSGGGGNGVTIFRFPNIPKTQICDRIVYTNDTGMNRSELDDEK